MRHAKKMTIAKRLGWGFGSLLALMVLITAIGIRCVAFMDETLTSAIEPGGDAQAALRDQLRGSVHDPGDRDTRYGAGGPI